MDMWMCEGDYIIMKFHPELRPKNDLDLNRFRPSSTIDFSTPNLVPEEYLHSLLQDNR
jgi:hypothetical protein